MISTCYFILAAVLMLCTASYASGNPPLLVSSDKIMMTSGEKTLTVSLKCPKFLVQDQWVGGADLPIRVSGDLLGSANKRMEATYAPVPIPGSGQLEVKLYVQWYVREKCLRKWTKCRMINTKSSVTLKEVVLEELHGVAAADCTPTVGQSYPVFLPGFFAGIEFPIAAVRQTGDVVSLGHRPGLSLAPASWFESRKIVYASTPIGEEKMAFKRYVAAHRPGAGAFHVNYNSWWTSPVPYTEKDILGLVNTFKTKLHDPYKVSFDTFTVDLGWSDPHTLWQVNAKSFPNQGREIVSTAAAMKSRLGFWISPSNCYSPQSLDTDWANENGYETYTAASGPKLCCLGGKKYAEAFKQAMVKLIKNYGSSHFKFDGYVLECPATNHGHMPGDLSQDATADGLLAAVKEIRKAAKNTWIETTCMGWNGSPWWLFYVDSVIGTYGDDAPNGRIPCPVYRESSTTARDYYNLQGAYWLVMPIVAQEVLGIIHQTKDPFTNDSVDVIMRGHMFMPVYMNPAYVDDAGWKRFAGLLTWARANASGLQQTYPIVPASWQNGKTPKFEEKAEMPREPYGYAHCSKDRGLIELRNPWIASVNHSLKLDESVGLSAGASKLSIVSLYPEPRLYGKNHSYGDTIQIPLAPYETLVLSVSPKQAITGLETAASLLQGIGPVSVIKEEYAKLQYNEGIAPIGPDWTSLVGDTTSSTRVAYECNVEITAPNAELLILNEGKSDGISCQGTIKLNGVEVKPTISDSSTGWSATGNPKTEHWQFLRVPLIRGNNTVSIDVYASAGQKLSAWIWAKKPGSSSVVIPNLLPQPEDISLESACLIKPFDVDSITAPVITVDRPVMRINGIYLDSIEPVSVTQGYGTLQKNRSVWEKPMMIGGIRYLRGLGTHAEARIVYALNGQYRRFQTLVGADGNTGPTITFTIKLDGATVWESGLMTQPDPAKLVDIDVTGKKQMELIVGDGGNGFSGDHADFAEAKLLK